MIALFVGAFMAGLVGSPHCIGMCGPFAVLCGDRASRSVAWHLGRLTTYAALGAVAGTAGRLLPGPSWIVTLVSAVLIIWFAGSLAGVWPEPNIVPPYLRRLATATAGAPGLAGRALFGLANGLLPCGLVYAALSIPVAVADPWLGALALRLLEPEPEPGSASASIPQPGAGVTGMP